MNIAANYDGFQKSLLHHLVTEIMVPPPPSPAEAHGFSPAQADAINPGTASTVGMTTYHATFVDDKLMAETTNRIQLFIQYSSDSSYPLFGHPQRGILTHFLAEDKFAIATAWPMDQLGLDTDTHNM